MVAVLVNEDAATMVAVLVSRSKGQPRQESRVRCPESARGPTEVQNERELPESACAFCLVSVLLATAFDAHNRPHRPMAMTYQDVEEALDEPGTEFFAAFFTSDTATYVKVRKKEARELFEVSGVETIKWEREGKQVYMDAADRF